MPTKITASSRNLLRSSVYSVLGTTSTGYGAGLVSRDVSVGQTITASDYRDLIDDLRRCWIHQTGGVDGFLTGNQLPTQGSLVTSARIVQLIDQVGANKYNTVPSQQLKDSLASSTSTIYENNTLTYEVDHSFRNAADANYFFNLGGSISAELSRAGGTYTGNTATWAGFIDWANSQISSTAYTWLQWNPGGVSTSINATYTSSTNYVVRLNIYASSNKSIRSVLNVTVSPPGAPGIPIIGTATATGTTTANVSFTAPASNGGAVITTYTATSSPEGITGTLSQAGSGTITVTGLTAGTAYTFTVTATNSVGTSAASGASNSITTWAVPVNTAAPAVSGTATVGQTLSTTNGTWTGTPTPTYAYQWQRGGANISGATGSTYTLVSADVGSAIRCVVTATNTAGSASANSNATSSVTAVVSGTVPVNTVVPAVSGTATVGQTLTTTTGTWTGTPTPTYAYQWQRGGANISGATGSTYTLVSADVGSAIRCVVTATNTAGSASANSNATSSVAADNTPFKPVNTVLPEISGLAVIGNILTVTTGTWTGNPSSITYTYQWQRLGVDISGATSSTYTLVREDAYDTENDPPKISCIVTARNTVGSTSANSRTTIFVIFPRNPSLPRNLQIINTTESPRTVTLAWDPPEDDGWAPITKYYVSWNSNLDDGNNASGYYGASFGYTYPLLNSDTTQLIIPVNDSTTYGFRVKAYNAYKDSEAAVLSRATGPLGPLLSFTMTPSEVNITEGESVTFNITPNNAAIGTTLYWIVTPSASSSEQNDWTQWAPAGPLYYEGQPLSITLTGKLDGVNEGTETFTLSLYPQPGMPDIYKYLYASATINISDPAK